MHPKISTGPSSHLQRYSANTSNSNKLLKPMQVSTSSHSRMALTLQSVKPRAQTHLSSRENKLYLHGLSSARKAPPLLRKAIARKVQAPHSCIVVTLTWKPQLASSTRCSPPSRPPTRIKHRAIPTRIRLLWHVALSTVDSPIVTVGHITGRAGYLCLRVVKALSRSKLTISPSCLALKTTSICSSHCYSIKVVPVSHLRNNLKPIAPPISALYSALKTTARPLLHNDRSNLPPTCLNPVNPPVRNLPSQTPPTLPIRK